MELAQLAFGFEESKRQERLKALIEERRRLEDGAGRSAKVCSAALHGTCCKLWKAVELLAANFKLLAVTGSVTVRQATSTLVPLPQAGGAKPASSSAVAGAEDLVEKEAVGGWGPATAWRLSPYIQIKGLLCATSPYPTCCCVLLQPHSASPLPLQRRLEVMKRRQERELAQLIQVCRWSCACDVRLAPLLSNVDLSERLLCPTTAVHRSMSWPARRWPRRRRPR